MCGDFWSLVNFSMSSFGALQDFCPVPIQFCLSDSYLFSVVVKFLPVCACVCIYLCILRLIAVRVYICSVFGHSFISCFFSWLSYSTYDKECPPNTCPVSVCLCLHVHMSMCVGHCDIIQRPDTPRWWSLNIKPMCFYPFISVCMELLWKCLSCLFIVWV